MNIDTLKAIEFVVTNCPFGGKIKITTDSSEAKGKWFHKIIFEVAAESDYTLRHIEYTGKVIGSLFGEGLWVGYFDNKLKLVLS